MPDPFDNLFLHLATMMLIAFKLVQFIDWSWWAVFAPSILALFLYVFALFSSE